MNGIPNEIPDLGDAQLKPRQNPEFVPGTGFGTEDYFVWSRCDGTVSLRDIILMVGLGTERSIAVLSKLRSLGAVLMPGETQAPSIAPKAAAPEQLLNASPDELEALASDLALSAPERTRILLFRRRLTTATLFELLEVDTDADRRNVKRAYYRLSKEFHPDRYYGQDIGLFKAWLAEVFEAVAYAFKVLGDNKKRVRYEAELRGEDASTPQTKEEHADALFQNACDAELHGESEQALKLFAASIRMHEQPRVLRRAAMCAVHADELSTAEDYAKKAATLCDQDASYLRTLADVYRAGARLQDAHEVLERALILDTENDVLFTELKSDLASVQASILELEASHASEK